MWERIRQRSQENICPELKHTEKFKSSYETDSSALVTNTRWEFCFNFVFVFTHGALFLNLFAKEYHTRNHDFKCVVAKESTKCLRAYDKFKDILCLLCLDSLFCFILFFGFSVFSFFYLRFVCLFGPLSTSPVDSDLRWTLIWLDLSCSQGEGLEIGLSSDWKVWPWGKGTREVKKKTTLSFG